jgi:hypothetical protein
MNTIQKLNGEIHSLANKYIPVRLHDRFIWGLVALGLTEFHFSRPFPVWTLLH